jgi:hypothetical protein
MGAIQCERAELDEGASEGAKELGSGETGASVGWAGVRGLIVAKGEIGRGRGAGGEDERAPVARERRA